MYSSPSLARRSWTNINPSFHPPIPLTPTLYWPAGNDELVPCQRTAWLNASKATGPSTVSRFGCPRRENSLVANGSIFVTTHNRSESHISHRCKKRVLLIPCVSFFINATDRPQDQVLDFNSSVKPMKRNCHDDNGQFLWTPRYLQLY